MRIQPRRGWSNSWKKTTVSDEEWRTRRGELRAETSRWLVALRSPLQRYAAERHDGEAFGDFVVRAGIVRPMLNGRDFQR